MRLDLQGISKRFGDFYANRDISITVGPGEIHALLGENGAGKSTLMNVLYGLYQPDAGQIVLDGSPVKFSSPRDAMAAGIGMVHQHFMLVPVFTVAENVVLGHEPIRGPDLIDVKAAKALVRRISGEFKFDVDPDAYVENLPVGVQQRVEIIKALSTEAKILILDEPTAVLTPQETDELLGIMRQLADRGTSIVFITHKLREVRAVADKITVIRLGRVVGNCRPTDSPAELASLMVGRPVELGSGKQPPKLGDVALRVEGVNLVSASGAAELTDISLDVRGGEILALAGVQGNGQTVLVETLIGLRKPTAGSSKLNGEELGGRSVRQVLGAGVGYVPEDRSRDGMISALSIAENLVLDQFDRPPFGHFGALDVKAINQNATTQIKAFDVRAGSALDPISTLSGGNAQKVILARELSRELRLLIAANPTRGLDVGSIETVHAEILEERNKGIPVIVASTELDEIAALADRIAVMYRGRILGVVPGDTPREVLGLMMAGVPLEAAQAGQGAAPDQAADSAHPPASAAPTVEGGAA
ncbi:MAG: ABC transporter ATP-binding protein [Bifidobacteriaceae bacterium]|jgi:simple sugar transport system ATP-binding protein|nr:ABC transporter ATP-binding protein [Bifidobacteriaceae bacterium]